MIVRCFLEYRGPISCKGTLCNEILNPSISVTINKIIYNINRLFFQLYNYNQKFLIKSFPTLVDEVFRNRRKSLLPITPP